jgi:hypothetical protein
MCRATIRRSVSSSAGTSRVPLKLKAVQSAPVARPARTVLRWVNDSGNGSFDEMCGIVAKPASVLCLTSASRARISSLCSRIFADSSAVRIPGGAMQRRLWPSATSSIPRFRISPSKVPGFKSASPRPPTARRTAARLSNAPNAGASVEMANFRPCVLRPPKTGLIQS